MFGRITVIRPQHVTTTPHLPGFKETMHRFAPDDLETQLFLVRPQLSLLAIAPTGACEIQIQMLPFY